VPSRSPPILALAALVLLVTPGLSPAEPGLFIDPLDGAFDADRFLASRYGFVPLIVPITEPAVGYGAAAGLVFLHGTMVGEKGPTGRRIPPSITAVVGMATSNGSWAAAAGHLGHWREGTIRYLGGAGFASLRLATYPADVGKLEFQIETVPVVQELTFAVPGSDLTAGARYVLAGTRVHLRGDGTQAGIDAREQDALISGLGPVIRWDSRDGIFSPDVGVRAEASGSWFAPWLGSDLDFWLVRVRQEAHTPIAPWLNAALRLDLQLSGGDTPFWARPYVSLRGVPAMRYQGQHVVVAETEERIDFTARWSAVVFGGVGVAAAAPRPVTAWNAGSGFRYLLARQFGVRVGLDVARGPEDWAFYVIFGNAWN